MNNRVFVILLIPAFISSAGKKEYRCVKNWRICMRNSSLIIQSSARYFELRLVFVIIS